MEHRTLMRRRKQRVKYVLQTLHVVGLNRLLLEVTIRGLPTTIKESFVADVRYRLTELSPGQANGERKGQPAVVSGQFIEVFQLVCINVYLLVFC
ncbi:hypothetical protein HanRHA438_Chr03g0142031 [Helianthus annuus]|nr:hypothetical protein HanRHA438_Chr03g0142031 [Helianthus annuus]